MRMWMVNPKIMCRKHLLGEHVELHMFVGSINKDISMNGYLKDNLLEPSSLHSRHNELVKEMKERGYNHNSILPLHKSFSEKDYLIKIDIEESLTELIRRCPECASRYGDFKNER